MKITTPEAPSSERPPVRWWPAAAILALLALAIFYFRAVREDSQQWRNVYTMETCVVCFALSLVWVLFLSRLRWKVRLLWSGSAIGIIGLAAATVRIHGVTGDLVPIFKFPWSRPPSAPASTSVDQTTEGRPSPIDATAPRLTDGFPQFLGPLRNATLPEGPKLARDWIADPPRKLWRQPIGAGWSGFAIAGNRAVTLEQHGEDERVVCYELLSGHVLWSHADRARYFTTIAGEGPRTTPGIAGGRVVTLACHRS